MDGCTGAFICKADAEPIDQAEGGGRGSLIWPIPRAKSGVHI